MLLVPTTVLPLANLARIEHQLAVLQQLEAVLRAAKAEALEPNLDRYSHCFGPRPN